MHQLKAAVLALKHDILSNICVGFQWHPENLHCSYLSSSFASNGHSESDIMISAIAGINRTEVGRDGGREMESDGKASGRWKGSWIHLLIDSRCPFQLPQFASIGVDPFHPRTTISLDVRRFPHPIPTPPHPDRLAIPAPHEICNRFE